MGPPPHLREGPIVACATGGRSPAALAVVRLSGFASLDAVRPLVRPPGALAHGRARLVRVVDPASGKFVDQAVATYFEAPRSYTGEHVLELSVHGNPLLVDRVVGLFRREAGFAPALPGEFTYRALARGKLALSQVEGLDLLLNASSGLALAQGAGALDGDLRGAFLDLREGVVRLKAALELFIDFSEDVGEREARAGAREAFAACLAAADRLARRGRAPGGLADPRICLAGPVNAGKSTLFNAIVGEERSIVSPEAGTTRDHVGEPVLHGGTRFLVADTAGLRPAAGGPVEREGQARARALLDAAFFKVLVADPTAPPSAPPEGLPGGAAFDLLVLTHADRAPPGPPPPPPEWCRGVPAGRTVRTGLGPGGPAVFAPPAAGAAGSAVPGRPAGDAVLSAASRRFGELAAGEPLLVERQALLVDEVREALLALGPGIDRMDDAAALAAEADAVAALADRLIGAVPPGEALDAVFSRFCIGK